LIARTPHHHPLPSHHHAACAGELSGGQRRKLSVAISFLGRPSVVFLDEPTSGMDPYSRRFTWEVVRRRARSAAIVLTTHSMEEADTLADDIAIMAQVGVDSWAVGGGHAVPA
jgi:ABC-type multidrug transport system ATPase subunit